MKHWIKCGEAKPQQMEDVLLYYFVEGEEWIDVGFYDALDDRFISNGDPHGRYTPLMWRDLPKYPNQTEIR